MDLTALGEVGGRLCRAFAAHKGVEIEEEDFEFVANTLEEIVVSIHERTLFTHSVSKDLNDLEVTEKPSDLRDHGIEPPV